jgi:hypothetical protein
MPSALRTLLHITRSEIESDANASNSRPCRGFITCVDVAPDNYNAFNLVMHIIRPRW